MLHFVYRNVGESVIEYCNSSTTLSNGSALKHDVKIVAAFVTDRRTGNITHSVLCICAVVR